MISLRVGTLWKIVENLAIALVWLLFSLFELVLSLSGRPLLSRLCLRAVVLFGWLFLSIVLGFFLSTLAFFRLFFTQDFGLNHCLEINFCLLRHRNQLIDERNETVSVKSTIMHLSQSKWSFFPIGHTFALVYLLSKVLQTDSGQTDFAIFRE